MRLFMKKVRLFALSGIPEDCVILKMHKSDGNKPGRGLLYGAVSVLAFFVGSKTGKEMGSMGRKNRRQKAARRKGLGFNPSKYIAKQKKARKAAPGDSSVLAASGGVSVFEDGVAALNGGELAHGYGASVSDGALISVCGASAPCGGALLPCRGDVWFADLGKHPGTSVQEGCRPVFIMSNDTANGHSPTVTVVPMTSKKKKAYLPTHVLLGAGDCPFLGPSMALAEQITTIGKSALCKRIGRIGGSKIGEIEAAVLAQLSIAASARMGTSPPENGTIQEKEMVSYGS